VEYFSVFSSLEGSEKCKHVCVTNRDKFGLQKVCVPGAAENIQPILDLLPAKWKIENFHKTFRIKITLATDANLESESSSESQDVSYLPCRQVRKKACSLSTHFLSICNHLQRSCMIQWQLINFAMTEKQSPSL